MGERQREQHEETFFQLKTTEYKQLSRDWTQSGHFPHQIRSMTQHGESNRTELTAYSIADSSLGPPIMNRIHYGGARVALDQATNMEKMSILPDIVQEP